MSNSVWTLIDAWIQKSVTEKGDAFGGVLYCNIKRERKNVFSNSGENCIDALREYVVGTIEPMLTSYKFQVQFSDVPDYTGPGTSIQMFDHTPNAIQNSHQLLQVGFDRERESWIRERQSYVDQISMQTDLIKELYKRVSDLHDQLLKTANRPLELSDKMGEFMTGSLNALAVVHQQREVASQELARANAFNDPMRDALAEQIRNNSSGWAQFVKFIGPIISGPIGAKVAKGFGVTPEEAAKMAEAAKMFSEISFDDDDLKGDGK